MSNFFMFAILLSVLGTECFGAEHAVFNTVKDYFNARSFIKNLLEDDNNKNVNEAPRGTMACARVSAKKFQTGVRTLLGSCESAIEKGEEGDLPETVQQPDTSVPATGVQLEYLSVQNEHFAEYFVKFLAEFWDTVLVETEQCVPKAMAMPENIKDVYSFISRRLEKFTVDMFTHCRIPAAFYPGLTFRRQFAGNIENVEAAEPGEIREASFQDNIKQVYESSTKLISTTNIPVMIHLMDGLQKSKSIGCVRNASYMLFAELRSFLSGACSKANEEISSFHSMVLSNTPPNPAEKQKYLPKQPSMLEAPDGVEPEEILRDQNEQQFKSAMEILLLKLKNILDIFEKCAQIHFSSPYDAEVRQMISTALNNFDLEIVKCEIPLTDVHPSTETRLITHDVYDPSQQLQPPSAKEYIQFEEDTRISKFFTTNKPLSVKCFKSLTSNLFEDLKNLLDEPCTDAENQVKEFERSVFTNKGVSELIDTSSTDLFETQMMVLDTIGLQVLSAYRLCMEKEKMFKDKGKVKDFAASVIQYQDFYEGCGAGILYSPKPQDFKSRDSKASTVFTLGPFESSSGAK